jgi:integrase/recombinase XerD
MLSPTLARILAKHIGDLHDGPLFMAAGRRLSTRQIQRIISLRIHEAGSDKPITAHSLRHSFATALYNSTCDIRLVQQALRHTHVTTTEIYAQTVTSRWLKEVGKLA